MISFRTIYLFLLLGISNAVAQDFSFDQIIKTSPELANIMQNDSLQVQIIYTQIDRDESNQPTFRTYTYQVDSSLYFYPASTVKMPTAFLALQQVNELGIDRDTPLKIGADRFVQTSVESDSSSQNNLPSIAQYIHKIFLVSDNDAYNRLYELLGQNYINTELHKKGFSDSFIKHRLVGGYDGFENKWINPFWFYTQNGNVLFNREGTMSSYPFFPLQKQNMIRGKGYFDDDLGKVVYEPFNFSQKNFISLANLHGQLQRVIFPQAFSQNERFQIREEDYSFLYRQMSMLPRESKFPKYDLPDNYVKNILFGDEPASFQIPNHIKMLNKPGWAYGFMTDVAYVADSKNEIEFFLSVQLLVNENQIFNDGKYQYESVGAPFMGKLGKKIYEIELNRKRKYKPDLHVFFP